MILRVLHFKSKYMRKLFLVIFQIAVYNFSSAATFTVTNGNDSGAGSLREAVTLADASPGLDVINVDPSVFLITLTTTVSSFSVANLPDLKDLDFIGNGVVIQTTIDSFFATIRENVTINDTNFSGFKYGCLTIIPVDNGLVRLFNCNFSNCSNFLSLLPGGGAVQQWDGQLELNTCMFNNCSADDGGGVFIRQNSDATLVNGCTFMNNTATNLGNAIHIKNDNDVELSNFSNYAAAPDQDIYRATPEGGFASPTVTLLPSFTTIPGSILIIN